MERNEVLEATKNDQKDIGHQALVLHWTLPQILDCTKKMHGQVEPLLFPRVACISINHKNGGRLNESAHFEIHTA